MRLLHGHAKFIFAKEMECEVPETRSSYSFEKCQMSPVLCCCQDNIFVCSMMEQNISSNELLPWKNADYEKGVYEHHHLHSSQGMASAVQSGSSKALIHSSGTDTFPT